MNSKNSNARAGDPGAAKTSRYDEPALDTPRNSKKQINSLRFGRSPAIVRIRQIAVLGFSRRKVGAKPFAATVFRVVRRAPGVAR
jgi:hypothetical protein